jgi:hypothetical protein
MGAAAFAGAFMFFGAGAGPASAGTSAGSTGGDCKLGSLLCGILGAGKGKPAPANPSGGGTSHRPHPKTAAPAHRQAGGSGSGGGRVPHPYVPPASGLGTTAPQAYSQQRPPVLLPDIMSQYPQVPPETAPAEREQARLVAATGPAGTTTPPVLVATAAGLAGVVAAFNVSVLNRRLRHQRHDGS